MVSNSVTIIFTVTPSQLQHTNQCLPWSGHTPSASHYHQPFLPQPQMHPVFLEHRAQSWSELVRASRPSPTYLHIPETSWAQALGHALS